MLNFLPQTNLVSEFSNCEDSEVNEACTVERVSRTNGAWLEKI